MMKRFGMILLVSISVAFPAWNSVQAADPQMKINTTPRLNNASESKGAIKALKQPIQLSPEVRMRSISPKFNLTVKMEQLQKQFEELGSKAQMYEIGVAGVPIIEKQCAEKSYSIQDQQAAGCNENEPLSVCMEKLVKDCVSNFSASGMSIGGVSLPGGMQSEGVNIPSMSVQSFREAAIQTAAEARALSQRLNQYAIQAEQSANAWK